MNATKTEQIIAHELSNSLVSLRLANIYDLSSRIFLLKFAKPDHREQLLIDSGFRCHLTGFSRATAAAPSAFVARLRKHLRTRRVTAVSQIGTDRVLELQFSDGAYRLFLEFYAGGNVVLTDAGLTVLALLRNVSEGAEHEQYRLGLKYDLSLRQNYGGVPALTEERVRAGIESAVRRQQEEAQKPGKKTKKKAGDALRRALAVTTTEFPPVLIDHALEVTSFDRETPPERVLSDEDTLAKLMLALEEAGKVVADITSAETAKGYILAKRKRGGETEADDNGEEDTRKGLVYDDFHPFKPAQLSKDESTVFLEHDGFNKAVDKFFSSIEGQKLESRLQEREDVARRKIEQAREEQAKRIGGLQQVQELNVLKAQAIEANVERVEEAVAAVNGLISQGMDWVDIGKLVENEKARGNPVAETIKLPLKLEENTVTLMLSEFDQILEEEMADETESEDSDDSDEDGGVAAAKRRSDPGDKRLAVDIDLALSPWANAREYYDHKRAAAVKQGKTAQASEKALKSTEQKVLADLKKGLKQEKELLRPVRKQMWFEKFIYFVSSDGYLVLAGKDAQQNEMLYRRHLRKGDVYVHADLQGAASVVIKNNAATPEAPIPPSTLSQAGSLAVCTSSAWESKAVMSAWWVNGDQVSKTAPTGEYLTTGGFTIRGKKNFLPPAQLLLGFAVMFQISEESKAKHVKHRLRDVEAPAASLHGGGDGEGKADAGSTGEVDREDEDDEDDEFPDAARGDGGEDDDDFPDAARAGDDDDDHDSDVQEQDDGHSSEEEGDQPAPRSNPLQTYKSEQAEARAEDGSDDDQGDEDQGDEDERNQTTSTPNPQMVHGEGAQNGDMTAGMPSDEAQGVRHLSAKERKTKHKGGQETSIQNDSDARSEASTRPPGTSKQAPQVRGKRGKAKKMASRYADQDEEDRELAMKLLGGRGAEEKRRAEAADKADKGETEEEARARRKAQHAKTQKAGLEAEEMRRLTLSEGADEADEEEAAAAALGQLDGLVGTPLPGDEILEAIPICAPWGALGRFKYKAKLQPGQQKKGKAVREILGKWAAGASSGKNVDQAGQDSEKIWPREAELLKAWREAEVVGVIPVKQVRVMMGGGSAGGGGDKSKGGRGGKSGRGGKGSKRR